LVTKNVYMLFRSFSFHFSPDNYIARQSEEAATALRMVRWRKQCLDS